MLDEEYIKEDFLLKTKTARELYRVVRNLPIIDFHCHLPPEDIAGDTLYANMAQIWLAGDHYKWRAMRVCGVDEQYITGQASDWEKFYAFARSVPKMLRNPLYHWTHLELKRPFGISDRLLNEYTAESVWEECNDKLSSRDFSARSILRNMNVEVVCTTDDAVDSLEHHKQMQGDASLTMKPTFRPDRGMQIGRGEAFTAWVGQLSRRSDTDITTVRHFMEALRNRHDFFAEMGCRASDSGIEEPYDDEYTGKEIEQIFDKAMQNKPVSVGEDRKFKSMMLHELALMNHEKGWVFQLHIGALRNNNTRMHRKLGPDSGYDSMGDPEMARPLSRFLDRLDSTDRLPKTILYNLNPTHNEVFATMAGNFQDGRTPGKIQHGPAWWFLDQKDGMEKQLNSLSNMGLLSHFVGMITDSRSFLSFPRHEYYRRLVCDMLGDEIETGLIPQDRTLVENLLEDICYNNALKYFNLE
ncbi:MAG: glucuronate isomerase [Balneolales bacterium]